LHESFDRIVTRDNSINSHQRRDKLPAHQLHPSPTASTRIPRPTTTFLWPIRAVPTPGSDRKQRNCKETPHIGVLGGSENFEANQPHFAVGSIGKWFSYHLPHPTLSRLCIGQPAMPNSVLPHQICDFREIPLGFAISSTPTLISGSIVTHLTPHCLVCA
jgi:hypothetical protein